MRIFSTEKDGRREGLRRDYSKKSELERAGRGSVTAAYGMAEAGSQHDYGKAGSQQDYGEAIARDALNPQRKSSIISNSMYKYTDANARLMANSGLTSGPDGAAFHMYNRSVPDAEFRVAAYGADPRRQTLAGGRESRSVDRTDMKFNNQDVNMAIKSAVYAMSDAVLRAETRQDMDLTSRDDDTAGSSVQTRRQANAPMPGATNANNLKTDTRFTESEQSAAIKSLVPQMLKSQTNQQQRDGTAPDGSSYEGVMLSGKVSVPFADLRAVQEHILRDGAAPIITDKFTPARVSGSAAAAVGMATGATTMLGRSSQVALDALGGGGTNVATAIYKGNSDAAVAAPSRQGTVGAATWAVASTGQARARGSAQVGSAAETSRAIAVDTAAMTNNVWQDRRGAGSSSHGTKYTQRYGSKKSGEGFGNSLRAD
jgi:hypothetical protein